MDVKNNPIFILWARSFWWALGATALLFGAGSPVLQSVAFLLAPIVRMDPEALASWLNNAAPAILWVIALIERSGAARPYTLNPKAT